MTALTSARCPECGWTIDWELAKFRDESRRLGTPVYQATGWGRIRSIPATLIMMLIRPIQFARRVRADEPIVPLIIVFVGAFLICFGLAILMDGWPSDGVTTMAIYLACIVSCIAWDLACFSLTSFGSATTLRLSQRIQLLVRMSLYSTFFVALWPLVEGPPIMHQWNDANFYWPFNTNWRVETIASIWSAKFARLLGRSIIFYWWVAIVTIFAIVRLPGKWRLIVYPMIPIIGAWIATQVGAALFN